MEIETTEHKLVQWPPGKGNRLKAEACPEFGAIKFACGSGYNTVTTEEAEVLIELLKLCIAYNTENGGQHE